LAFLITDAFRNIKVKSGSLCFSFFTQMFCGVLETNYVFRMIVRVMHAVVYISMAELRETQANAGNLKPFGQRRFFDFQMGGFMVNS